jgi:predicted phage terminase large subunit-like protein
MLSSPVSDPDAMARMVAYQSDILKRTVADNPWIPTAPFAKQAMWLALPTEESLFGGSLGGGKSEAMLMAAAQYVDRPHYRALIIRRSIAELEMPGALIERSRQWWGGTSANYNDNKHRWKFPSGAEIWFGYLQSKDWARYQSSEWDFIGFDEIVTIPEVAYTLLWGRVRKNILHRDLEDVPPRVRGASNPPTADQERDGWWVKLRFVDRGFPFFVQSNAGDNPYLEPGYFDRLRRMYDPVTFAKLASGDWSIRASGGMFKRDMMAVVDTLPASGLRATARGWDLAATKPSPANPDPDWTRGVLVSRFNNGLFYIRDMVSMRDDAGPVASMVTFTARTDRQMTTQVLPQDPAQAGKAQAQAYIKMLAGYAVKTVAQTHQLGGKITRATPFIIQAQAGNIRLLRGPWNKAFYEELESVPFGHMDILDASAFGFNEVALSAPQDIGESGWAAAWQQATR